MAARNHEREYTPIACSTYDVLEAAALQRRPLRLQLREKEMDVLIKDVYARGKEEFLDAVDLNTGESVQLRLDQVANVIDPSDGKVYSTQAC